MERQTLVSTGHPAMPSTCSFCGAQGTLTIEGDGVICRICGHKVSSPELAVTPRPAVRRKLTPSYRVDYKGELDPWARAAFDTGQDCIRREDWAGAIEAFTRALDAEEDFTDAHLWLARLLDDPAQKRDHLTSLLAQDPNHLEAIRELMVLDGRMTQTDADRTHHYNEPEMRQAGAPVGTETTVLKCPVCEGDLTINHDLQQVECQFCGFSDVYRPRQADDVNSLTMALLQRKAQAVEWIIGERLLHCNNCGAERILAGTVLSARCPFCGSNHVIERDALGSFQQPDGLVPFRITRQQAASAIKTRLSSWSERMKGWFDNNKVARGKLDAVYLPFWVFDAIVDVTRTTIDTSRGQVRMGQSQTMTRESLAELVNDLPVCAVESPLPYLTRQLGPYEIDDMVAYSPELLADYPASLYSITFDDASLTAREVIGKAMREKHGRPSNDDVKVNIFSGITNMTFQLALLPVWVGTLYEHDGDMRPALVNGQTGLVVLGKAQKPRT